MKKLFILIALTALPACAVQGPAGELRDTMTKARETECVVSEIQIAETYARLTCK